MRRLLPNVVRIGSLGPTGPKCCRGSSALTGVLAARSAVTAPARASLEDRDKRNIVGVLLASSTNQLRASLQLLRCGDRTMLQCKTKGRGIFPNARFGFQMMRRAEKVATNRQSS